MEPRDSKYKKYTSGEEMSTSRFIPRALVNIERKVVIVAVILGILVVSYMFLYQLPRENEILSMDAILQDITENPGDLRLGVHPGTVEILTAELMKFEQLPENEQKFIGGIKWFSESEQK